MVLRVSLWVLNFSYEFSMSANIAFLSDFSLQENSWGYEKHIFIREYEKLIWNSCMRNHMRTCKFLCSWTHGADQHAQENSWRTWETQFFTRRYESSFGNHSWEIIWGHANFKFKFLSIAKHCATLHSTTLKIISGNFADLKLHIKRVVLSLNIHLISEAPGCSIGSRPGVVTFNL